jgi:hypothetical protein
LKWIEEPRNVLDANLVMSSISDATEFFRVHQNVRVFLLVGGKTHCALIAARASDVSTWEI